MLHNSQNHTRFNLWPTQWRNGAGRIALVMYCTQFYMPKTLAVG